jgi:hypothetical protein
MIIYSPASKHDMFVEYINSLLIRDNDKCIVWKMGDAIEITDDDSIVIFMQVIPNKMNEIIFKNTKPINIFLCNTEQMSNYIDELIHHIKPFHKNTKDNVKFGIIDYSESNIRIIKEHEFITKHDIKCYYIPYQYNKKEVDFLRSIKTDEKKICTCGVMTGRRKNIVDKLMNEQTIKVDPIKGFGELRDKQLMKYKILLNLSVAENHGIYEHIRCDRLIFSKMIIISEKKYDNNLLDVYDLVLWYDVNAMAEKIREVIRNYSGYKNMISDEKLEKIASDRFKTYTKFRNEYDKYDENLNI